MEKVCPGAEILPYSGEIGKAFRGESIEESRRVQGAELHHNG